MNRLPGLLLLFIAFFAGTFTWAQTPREVTIEVSAAVQESPPRITLNWLPTIFPVTLQKIFRKPKGAPVWTDLAPLATSATGYIDSSVAAGVSYEYFVFRIFSTTDPGSASGYANAGIRIPLVPSRGRAILLVDDTMAASLATELTRFTEDLTGDGWNTKSFGASYCSVNTVNKYFYNMQSLNRTHHLESSHIVRSTEDACQVYLRTPAQCVHLPPE